MKQHIENKHEGVRYLCDQSEYVATVVQYLKIHIRSKHEGVRYLCDQCEHVATLSCHLKKTSKKETLKLIKALHCKLEIVTSL